MNKNLTGKVAPVTSCSCGIGAVTVWAMARQGVDVAINASSSGWQRVANSLDRCARPDAIAVGVAFLAGPQASLVTNAVPAVDGGHGA